ncbi:Cell division control protein 73 [Wickerhamiella sorbophila]|uniref:Cell division control protein 73 n=1 Tax=Wickerhamiella sorbophila TaxID=45607 RepID=A0A2T0FJR7_9ASCO|nr:Cell division control protein 73 [Wickerhamiella sorbophila]PRT55231.1 Cell division control protein 73 [Wickerhamiella sorbophila]
MSDPLVVLRTALAGNHKVEIVSGPSGEVVDFATGQGLRALLPDGEVFLPFEQATRFESETVEGGVLDVKTAWFAWVHKNAGITDYISAAEEQGIGHLRFLERTDLISWLDGSSAESEFIKGDAVAASGAAISEAAGATQATAVPAPSGRVEKRPMSEDMKAIYEKEKQLANHNTVLHGSKKINFSGVSAQSHREIIHPFKSSSKRPAAEARTAGATQAALQPGKNQDPIILLSPSPSSMINMANVKEFLENGVFDPVLRQAGSPNLLRISRKSPVLGNLRFIVVDSTEKFKPEYWNRVVAVFATGQAWQFNSYKWSDPNTLFHHVLGFALVYKGDQMPQQLKEWNVKVETLDRVHRFRDRELVERIWDRLEANMIARGWPVKR